MSKSTWVRQTYRLASGVGEVVVREEINGWYWAERARDHLSRIGGSTVWHGPFANAGEMTRHIEESVKNFSHNA